MGLEEVIFKLCFNFLKGLLHLEEKGRSTPSDSQGGTPDSMLRNNSLKCLREYWPFQGSNQGQFHVSQVYHPFSPAPRLTAFLQYTLSLIKTLPLTPIKKK